MSVTVIVNPRAGGVSPDVVRSRVADAREAVQSRGGSVHLTARRGHAYQLACEAVKAGHHRVIAWGGDGTVNEVAQALAFGVTVLGIVPSGSGNGLARALGLGANTRRALHTALDAAPVSIDAGELAGRLFFSVAGIGFDAHVAALFDTNPSARRGMAMYAWLAARALWTYRARTYGITLDGRRDAKMALLVTVANSSQWGNGARIAPAARVDDGQLDMVIVEERSRLMTCLAVPLLFTGGIGRAPGVSTRRLQRAVIDAEEEITFHVDGEPGSAQGPIEVRVHPGALRVAAPANHS